MATTYNDTPEDSDDKNNDKKPCVLPNASEDFHTGFIFLSDNDIDLPNGRPVSEWPKLSINCKV